MHKNKVYFGESVNIDSTVPNPFEGFDGRELTNEEKEKYFASIRAIGANTVREQGWMIKIHGLRKFRVTTDAGLREFLSPDEMLLTRRLARMKIKTYGGFVDITNRL